MINAVTNAPLNGQVRAMDKVSKEQLYSPGLYTMPELMELEHHHHEKQGSFLGFLGKLILTAAVIGAGAITIRKTLMDDYKVIDSIDSKVKTSLKVKNWFAKYTDKLYDITVGKLLQWAQKKAKQASTTNTTSSTNNASQNTPTDNKQ